MKRALLIPQRLQHATVFSPPGLKSELFTDKFLLPVHATSPPCCYMRASPPGCQTRSCRWICARVYQALPYIREIPRRISHARRTEPKRRNTNHCAQRRSSFSSVTERKMKTGKSRTERSADHHLCYLSMKGDFLFEIYSSMWSLSDMSSKNAQFDCSPPIEGNKVGFPAGSLLDFLMRESCRTMPLVDGFSRGSSVPRSFIPTLLHTHFTLIGAQELDAYPFAYWLHQALGIGLVSDWLTHTANNFLLAGLPAGEAKFTFLDRRVASDAVRLSRHELYRPLCTGASVCKAPSGASHSRRVQPQIIMNCVFLKFLTTPECQGGGNRKNPKKIRGLATSSGTIPTCENPGVTRLGIEPGSTWWEASSLIAQPPRTLNCVRKDCFWIQGFSSSVAVFEMGCVDNMDLKSYIWELDKYSMGLQKPFANNLKSLIGPAAIGESAVEFDESLDLSAGKPAEQLDGSVDLHLSLGTWTTPRSEVL
ncbi:hypothetical protein PR048_023603 [Dryococelus australis]|uniref:Uncharacterized protein n=1 Tax=Dryococelus australis TaxID=614101 RepID=A0ABQ9GUK3_9NEOP|nr:hypothetical protein PR048_023603 [Dryococelus australis]